MMPSELVYVPPLPTSQLQLKSVDTILSDLDGGISDFHSSKSFFHGRDSNAIYRIDLSISPDRNVVRSGISSFGVS